jgi:ribosomal protein S27E
MKISDLTCAHCGAVYLLAESVSVDGAPINGSAGDDACRICGKTLAGHSSGKLRAFRLMMSPVARPARTPLSATISP